MRAIYVNCVCCKKRIKIFSVSQSYCGWCAKYTRHLRSIMSRQKRIIGKLYFQVYGVSVPKVQSLNDKELNIVNKLRNKK
jgi:hypothetical protein